LKRQALWARARAAVKDLHFNRHDLDGTSSKLAVSLARQASTDEPTDGENPFMAYLLGCSEELLGSDKQRPAFRFEDKLGYAFPVTEINEDLIVVGPVGVHPTVEGHFLIYMGFSQLAAGMSPPHEGHGRFPSSENVEPRRAAERSASRRG
jgi:hypothetical protein